MSTYKMTLDFIGKDSVKFSQEYEIPEKIYNLIKELQAGKKDSDNLFSVKSGDVNAFLKQKAAYCTPKLFRTAYGCRLLVEELQKQKIPANATIAQKIHFYDEACLVVTKKLNHQKNIAKSFDSQMEKLDITIQKAIESENKVQEKAKEDLKKLQKQIKAAKASFEGERLEKALTQAKERKDKIQARVKKAQERIEALEMKKDFKGKAKEFNIGTARANYSSPKIFYSWVKDNGVPPERIFSKSLLAKFEWAKGTPADYWRKFPNVRS